MFTSKKKLLNEQEKVKNKDKEIEKFEDKLQKKWNRCRDLEIENLELKRIIKEIYIAMTSNNYNNEDVQKRKIIELAETAIKD